MNNLLTLKGRYVRVESFSNFTLRVSRVAKSERGFHRFVKVKIVGQKESPALLLPADALASALKFRIWLLNKFVNAQWTGGEKELDALRRDLCEQTVVIKARHLRRRIQRTLSK